MTTLTKSSSSLAILAATVASLASGAMGQTLTHRYSFNDTAGSTTFVDSVGGPSWNGSLVGSAALDGSALQLDGVGGFATLPSGAITNYSQVSFDFWATLSPNNPVWTRVFSFGDQDGGGGKRTGLDYCHYAGGDWQNLGLTTTNANVWANNPGGLNGQTSVHVSIIVDPLNNQMYYYNGTTVTSNPGVNGGSVPPLSGLSDSLALLGKSLYDVDALLEGSINEFRIYQGALTPAMVALNDAAGPNNYVTSPGALLAVHLATPVNPLLVNQNSQQSFTGDFANVTGLNLNLYGGATFTSGNTAVLTVNSTNGIVKAISPGTTTVIASYGALSATNSITVVSVPAVLAHRYSFTTDASDSVGAANGTLVGNATIAAGKAVLDGSFGTYIDLPGNLVALSSNQAVTIETWVDFGDTPGWCRLFNFGNDGGSSEIYLAPNGPGNGNQHRISENIPGGRNTDWRAPWANLSAHVTVVIDPPASTMSLYRDGVLEYARYDANAPLSLISTNLAVIGRSLVGVDPYMPGSIDEFRIYSGSLSPQEIATAHKNGPASLNHDPGALASIKVLAKIYPAFSEVIPPAVVANYANLTNFTLQPNNSAQIGGLVVTSSDPTIVAVRANNMLQTFRPGTVTLTATYLGKTDSATITVENVGTLAHRYSFTNDANDSVGTANGTLQGAATVAGGKLVLDGSDSTYLELPSGMVDGYDAITVDTWVTFNAAGTWGRLWTFGDNQANELFVSPSFLGGGAVHWYESHLTENGFAQSVSPRWENQTLHLTFVYGNGFMALYTNGAPESVNGSLMGRFDQIGGSWNRIGRSPYNDPFLNASIDEFRVYRGRLAADEILASDILGPNQALTTTATMSVSQAGGNAVLSWPLAAAGFSVQARTNLSSGTWVTLTNAPALSGGRWQVTVPDSTGARFFRLWR